MSSYVSILDIIPKKFNEIDFSCPTELDLGRNIEESFESTQDIKKRLIIFYVWLDTLNHLSPPNKNNVFIPIVLDILIENICSLDDFLRKQAISTIQQLDPQGDISMTPEEKSINYDQFIEYLEKIFSRVQLAKDNFITAEKYKIKSARMYNEWKTEYFSNLFEMRKIVDDAQIQLSVSLKGLGIENISCLKALAKIESLIYGVISGNEQSSKALSLGENHPKQEQPLPQQRKIPDSNDAESKIGNFQSPTPPQENTISRRKFKSVLSKHLSTERNLKGLCDDLETSIVELEVNYEAHIKSDEYKDNDNRNTYIEDSTGKLYDYLKRKGKLDVFVDWFSEEEDVEFKKKLV